MPRSIRSTAAWSLVFCGPPVLLLEVVDAPLPFAWIFGAWAMALFVLAFRRRAHDSSRVLLVLASVFLALALGEVVLDRPERVTRIEMEPSESMRRDDPVLGYAARPGAVRRVRSYVDDELVFDVTYTIGEDGLRRTGPAAHAKQSVLCFGGSFTFGAGVQDEEAYPQHLADALGDSYRVHNLGYGGYGPHQMLAALEQGFVEPILTAPPRAAVYLAINDHVRRASGMSSWEGDRGPCYLLGRDGVLEHMGTFAQARQRGLIEETGSPLRRWIKDRIGRSNVFGRWSGGTLYDDDDLDRFAAIVAAARDRVTALWPSCEFHVILWDSWFGIRDDILPVLRSQGLEVHLASDILPGFGEDLQPYALHEHDAHPSPKATEILGRYVAERIQRAR